MDEDKKMTIFYKLRTLEINVMAEDEDSGFEILGMDDIEDAKLLYGKITIPFNRYLLRHRQEFELIKDVNENLIIKMKEEYKEQAKQFL